MPFIRFLARFNRYIYIADFSGGTEGWLDGRSTGAGGGTQAAACGGIKKLRHLPYALAGAGGEDEGVHGDGAAAPGGDAGSPGSAEELQAPGA